MNVRFASQRWLETTCRLAAKVKSAVFALRRIKLTAPSPPDLDVSGPEPFSHSAASGRITSSRRSRVNWPTRLLWGTGWGAILRGVSKRAYEEVLLEMARAGECVAHFAEPGTGPRQRRTVQIAAWRNPGAPSRFCPSYPLPPSAEPDIVDLLNCRTVFTLMLEV
jgi:hypothetical protein